jgi:hypothetical protein
MSETRDPGRRKFLRLLAALPAAAGLAGCAEDDAPPSAQAQAPCAAQPTLDEAFQRQELASLHAFPLDRGEEPAFRFRPLASRRPA